MGVMSKGCGKNVMMGLAVLVLIGLVGFVIYRFSFVENDAQNDTISKYLVCGATDINGYTLTEENDVDGIDYEARMIFLNEKIYRVNFVVSRKFYDEKSTNLFTDRLSAAYNDYVGKNDISKKLIINTVNNVDNVGKMVISIEGNNFTDKMASLAMLDGTMVGASADEVQEYYEKTGYTCSIDEQDMVLSE